MICPVIAAERPLAVLSLHRSGALSAHAHRLAKPALRLVVGALALAAISGASYAEPVLPKSNEAKRCSYRKISKNGGPIKGCHWYIAGVLAKRFLATASSR